MGGIGESMSNAITAAHQQSIEPQISIQYDLGLGDVDEMKTRKKKKAKR
jgi:hypothetical protein